MEEFFRQPILEKLYHYLSTDFEEKLLHDKKESKKYYAILAAEEQLYSTLKEIVGNDKNKLEQLMYIITQLEDYCCKETEYWNKKYFKLGFTCMIDIKIPKNSRHSEKYNFSMKVHNFLDSLRTKNLDKKQKSLLSTFINNLKNGTEIQKRRFLMYYNLIPNNDELLGYCDIGKIEHCSGSAIRTSISAIILQLVRLEDPQKSLFLTIMNKIYM
ncbi:MAG: hypothetical protein HFJ37_05785 [Clostridia bacterium]|nr:hypothetical protein [Clostridia bacterium]